MKVTEKNEPTFCCVQEELWQMNILNKSVVIPLTNKNGKPSEASPFEKDRNRYTITGKIQSHPKTKCANLPFCIQKMENKRSKTLKRSRTGS